MISKSRVTRSIVAGMLVGIAATGMTATGVIETASAHQMGGGGMGPGMMGPDSTGSQNMGPGMMDRGVMRSGAGSQNMGPGATAGVGPGTMDTDPKGGYCPACGAEMGSGRYFGLDLDQTQRNKIAEIEKRARERQWNLMGQMREAQYKLQQLRSKNGDNINAPGMSAQAAKVDELQQQMVEANMKARDQVKSLLTAEQRDRLIHWNQAGVTPKF